jgi:phytoene dehydrogenase-like protein
VKTDVIVIGAGFGGMAAALELAAGGARVTLFEALRYAGGCASTFTRSGCRYESGATLFSGFAPGQLFDTWITRHAMNVVTETPDPMVELRTPTFTLPIPPDRVAFVDRLAALSGDDGDRVRAFFTQQTRVATALWSLFDDPSLLPPFDLASLARHAARVPKYLPLLALVGHPLEDALRSHGVAHVAPLRAYLDAVCQITVQTAAREAEAPFAMAAMDYYFRGTRHVRGGIGALATAMLGAIARAGGEVHLATRVDALEEDGTTWRVRTRRGEFEAPFVVANVLPQDLLRLAGRRREDHPDLDARARAVEAGWGAVMLYLTVRGDAALRPEAHHLELIDDPAAPFVEGNHLFCSISGRDETERAPHQQRTVTVSTHIAMTPLRAMSPAERAVYVSKVQARMRDTLAERAPELDDAITSEMTASPRTFERFTLRAEGLVGGVPRRAGLAHYRDMGPSQPMRGVYLVGDSVFPGQSTLAVAIGGRKAAERVLAGRQRLP